MAKIFYLLPVEGKTDVTLFRMPRDMHLLALTGSWEKVLSINDYF